MNGMVETAAAVPQDESSGEQAKAAVAKAIAAIPNQMDELFSRQDATEMVLSLVIMTAHPRLDELVDALSSMRKVAAESDTPRPRLVEAYDSYLTTLKMVREARRNAPRSPR